MANLSEILTGIASDVESVKAAQETQGQQITEISADVEGLHTKLEQAGVSQEILDQAQAIKSRLETVVTAANDANTALQTINDKTAAAQTEAGTETGTDTVGDGGDSGNSANGEGTSTEGEAGFQS